MRKLPLLAALFAAFALAACDDPDKLTEQDLETLCAAATEVSKRPPPKNTSGNEMIGVVIDGGRMSAGMRRMLSTELVTTSDKGAVVRAWSVRSGLKDFECAPLERIYPGSTGHPAP